MDDYSILVIGGLVLLSAVLSAVEIALLALTETKIHKYQESRGKLSHSLRLWSEHPQRVLSTLQTGDAIVDVTAIVLATQVCLTYSESWKFSESTQSWGLALAVGVMTLLTLIIGNVIPKALAARYADQLAIPAIRFLGFLYYPLSIFAIPLSFLSRMIIRLAGGNEESPQVTEDEIQYMINLGAREGVIDRNEGELLQSVLEFNDTIVRETMIPRTEIVSLSIDTDSTELVNTVVSGGHSRVPIYKDTLDNVIGILHTKDLFRLVQERGKESWELEPILRPPFFVPDTMKISKLLEEFQTKRSHLAIVFDEFGGTTGLITLEDILEEIVGEIQDEYDVDEKLVTPLSSGHFIVDARITMTELEEQTGLNLPEEEGYESLGGLVTSRLGKVPEVGSEISVDGLVLKVTEADEKHVEKIEIQRKRMGLALKTPTGLPKV